MKSKNVLVFSISIFAVQINSLLPLQTTAAACCEAICRKVIQDEDQWKIGRTKIVLKVKKTYTTYHVLPQRFSIVTTQQGVAANEQQHY